MFDLQRKMNNYCIEEVKKTYRRTFRDMKPELEKVMTSSGQVAFESIANSDAFSCIRERFVQRHKGIPGLGQDGRFHWTVWRPKPSKKVPCPLLPTSKIWID